MDRYIISAGSLLSSQLSLRQFNADVLPNSSAPYQLLVETEGGFVELVRQVTSNFLLRASDRQRDTVHDFVLTPIGRGETGVLSLANRGRQFYREFQVTGRYRIGRGTLNASYARARADSQTAKADFPAGVAR